MELKIKRIYDPVDTEDGMRILVDRLWPRGISKVNARLDLWLKDIGPSSELRKWFNHDPDKFNEFKTKYEAELDENPAVNKLKKIISTAQTVTLLYSARDTKMNQAVIIQAYLKQPLKR